MKLDSDGLNYIAMNELGVTRDRTFYLGEFKQLRNYVAEFNQEKFYFNFYLTLEL